MEQCSTGGGGGSAKSYITQNYVVALAGNPNVGKSTLFNRLTGLRQHTGNWSGKTVGLTQGTANFERGQLTLVDLPGCYSLLSGRAEEVAARDFICFGRASAILAVCDAVCLERNLNLVLQILEISGSTAVCVNLMDEANKKGISINLAALSRRLSVSVVGTAARSGQGTKEALAQMGKTAGGQPGPPLHINYPDYLEEAISCLLPSVTAAVDGRLNPRWVSVKLLEGDADLLRQVDAYLGCRLTEVSDVGAGLIAAKGLLAEKGVSPRKIWEAVAAAFVGLAEEIAAEVVAYKKADSDRLDRRLDKILTGRWVGYPVMLALLLFVFWLTLFGSNYPSALLAKLSQMLENPLQKGLSALGISAWLVDMLVLGCFRTLAWVVAVMLPPMAIFFPLFTLLEDLGYLPRVAFNLDKGFQRCTACGKQALTMCMGFGCNAAGVVGCRIIDSRRERLMAILTNSFVPCNGRFPALIALIAMFFAGTGGFGTSLTAALLLTGCILLGIMMTFLVSWFLSKTFLRGVPSAFALELPPYRRPQVGRVLVRSIFDRTFFVLGRAAAVAAPAGLIIFLLANVSFGGQPIYAYITEFLDPVGRTLGMDGVILSAFILGIPANEIVIPLIMMGYLANGTLTQPGSLLDLKTLFLQNGWTPVTAACTILFFLMHWPCATTCLTIKKEIGSLKWTALAFLLPTVCGMIVCFGVATAARLLI